MAYAEGTTIPVEKSMGEIVALLKKNGAERIAQVEEPEWLTIQFFMRERMLRFRVRLPLATAVAQHAGNGHFRTEAQRRAIAGQRQKQRARALLLVIKAKIESVESDVETFEEAFLPNIVLADGATVMERVREPIALEYAGGQPIPLMLEGPRRG